MGNFRYEGDKIILSYNNGIYQIYKTNPSHNYKVGTIFFDYNGDRYFLEN